MNNDFCEELKDVYKDKIFDNKVLKYYITSLFDVLDVKYEGSFKQLGFKYAINHMNGNKYVSDTVEKKNKNNYVKVVKNQYKNKKWILLEGQKDKIKYVLSIDDVNNNNELPFRVKINYEIEEGIYDLHLTKNYYFRNISINEIRVEGEDNLISNNNVFFNY